MRYTIALVAYIFLKLIKFLDLDLYKFRLFNLVKISTVLF